MDLICYIVFAMSVSCSLIVTCWEIADLLALLYVMFSCVFGTFVYDVLGQMWYLIIVISNLSLLLSYFALHFIAFHTKFNKFNNTRSQMLDSIYHLALKLLRVSVFVRIRYSLSVGMNGDLEKYVNAF